MQRLFPLVLLGSLASTLVACGSEDAAEVSARGAPGPVLVETIEARIQPVTRRVESVGTLYGDESVTLTAKVTEQVSAVHFEGGELVESGQVLAELMDAEQLALLSEAEANLREAELQLERLVTLGQEIATAAEIDVASARVDASAAQLDAIRSRLADRRIVAPFSGVLGFRRISVGALLTPGTIIAELDAIDPLKLDFSLPELFLAEVSIGDTIRGSSVAWPGLEFAGKVTRISSRVDPVSRAFQVRALLGNDDNRLRPGMLINVALALEEEPGIVVPERALIQVGDRSAVFVIDDGAIARRTEVTLGRRMPGQIVLRSGVEPGERVVVNGQMLLRPGASVREVDSSESTVGD
ncbi:MAG: efflux RND transporter periplasmic adaptor subunit [Pseudomonadota bacterium]